MKTENINRVAGALLILLSISVAIPLTIKTIVTNGGTWGFGIIGLAILLPLNAYLLFGLAAFISNPNRQRVIFIISHGLSILIGLVAYFIFPLFPLIIIAIPIGLSLLSFLDKKHLAYYLLLMILLALVANILLLKWELDFGRSIPILQLFQSFEEVTP